MKDEQQDDAPGLRHPFGEVSCEQEVAVLREQYPEYYFAETPFNDSALDPDTYLIVGRRGSGKTSLARYFSFQTHIGNATSIEVDEANLHYEIIERATDFHASSAAVGKITKLWRAALWSLLFSKFADRDLAIGSACLVSAPSGSVIGILKQIIESLITKFTGAAVGDDIDKFLTSTVFRAGQNAVLAITRKEPVLLAIDTMEQYRPDNLPEMQTTAGLIQAANQFNVSYSRAGIHVKVFLAAEIYPYLCENVVSNTLKVIRTPVFLHWRTKDLVRLICWRFSRYLLKHGHVRADALKEVDWADFQEVLKAIWIPFLGEHLTNGLGLEERTFPYVLRHTQQRPRQLVELCNRIAKKAIARGQFPILSSEVIVEAVREAEIDLAKEVVNSYATIYPRVGTIIDALCGQPLMFDGSLLDRIAPITAEHWPNGRAGYIRERFKKLVAELGIVGRVVHFDEASGHLTADFEYALQDHLPINSGDRYVIHPMFVARLRPSFEPGKRIIVHPSSSEFPWRAD